MEFPLVSIIVPMYNTAGCIARCVKSICAQTYKSIEILLLNEFRHYFMISVNCKYRQSCYINRVN